MDRPVLVWLGVVCAGLAYACAPLLSIDDVTYGHPGPDGGLDAAGADAAPVLKCEAVVLDPPSFDFGEVRVATDAGPGSTATFTLALRNGGVGARSVSLETDAPFTVKEGGPLGLASGESREVQIAFAPSAVGAVTGKIRVKTEDGCSSTADLAGSGTDALYALSPAKVDFGTVLCGKTASRTLAIDAAPGAGGAWTAALDPPFAVPPSGTLVTGAKTTITVDLATPFTTPGSVVEKVLTLGLPDKPRTVKVSASGRGGVIVLAHAPVQNGHQAIKATNTGNDVANIVWAGATELGYTMSPDAASIAPGDSLVAEVIDNGHWGTATIAAMQDSYKPGSLCANASIDVTYNDPGSSDSSSYSSGSGN